MKRKAQRKTVSSVENGRAFAFEGNTIAPASALYMDLRVARLPAGAWLSMPVSVLHGARYGPTVWVSAAVHGDELNGVAIVRRLLRRIDPRELSGTVIGVPMVNVFGVTMASRYLPDRRDLNRSFPGSARGSLAARLAHMFFEGIVARCELGIDFHTGSAGRFNLPQIRCDTEDPSALRLAEAFGAPLILHSDPTSGSLRAEAKKRGIRSLLYEAGEADRIDDGAVRTGVAGALRVLDALGMIEHRERPQDKPLLSRRSSWVRAPRSGFCVLEVEVGQAIELGQRLGSVIDASASGEREILCKNPGIVIGALKTAAVHRGDALVHVAELGET